MMKVFTVAASVGNFAGSCRPWKLVLLDSMASIWTTLRATR